MNIEINFFKNNIFKVFRFKLYQGYWRNIFKLSKLNLVSKVRKLIFNIHNTQVYNHKISNYLWKNQNFPDHKKIIQQYLVQKIGYKKMILSILTCLYQKKKIIFPLPKKWQYEIKKNNNFNLKLNSFLCSLLFNLIIIFFIFRNLIFSLIVFLKVVLKKIFRIYERTTKNNYAVLFNYPYKRSRIDKNSSKFSIKNWLNSYKKNETIITIDPNGYNQNIDNNICLKNIENIFIFDLKLSKFVFEYINYLIVCLSELLLFRYGSLLLINEFTTYLIVKNSNSKKFKFYFVWINNIYRPLWTYTTFHTPQIVSLSLMNEMRDNKENILSFDHEAYFLSTWSYFNVWTLQCKSFLTERLSNNPKIEVVGPIYSADNENKIEYNKKNIISVFGYETHKWPTGISTITDYQTHNHFIYNKFYEDIIDAVGNRDIYIAIKRKKEFRHLEKKFIKNLYEKLKKNPKIIYVDPKSSPYKLIENTDLTISLPFTSTSVAASYLSKKSIYYDPIQKVNKNDPSACGIEVINDKAELEKLIINHFSKSAVNLQK